MNGNQSLTIGHHMVSKKMPFHLVQKIIRCLKDHDSNNLFSDNISQYLNAKTFRNSDLFKTTYDRMRQRLPRYEVKYCDCGF